MRFCLFRISDFEVILLTSAATGGTPAANMLPGSHLFALPGLVSRFSLSACPRLPECYPSLLSLRPLRAPKPPSILRACFRRTWPTLTA